MVKQILRLLALPAAASVLLAVAGTGSVAAADKTKGAHDLEHPFKMAYKAKPSKLARTIAEFRNRTDEKPADHITRKGAPSPSVAFDSEQSGTYLEGPNGETWFYTSKIESENVFHPYDDDDPDKGWTEQFIKGFEFTIYDQTFKEVGTVKSDLSLQEGESKVFQVQLGSVVTKNFFNSDSRYEIMVYSSRNFEGMYGASQRTDVYSIGGEKDDNGYDKSIMSLEGYCVDAVNVPQDRYTENFYMTFAQDYSPEIDDFDDPIEYANACGMVFRIYKKGGWQLPQLIDERVVCQNNLPGDQENYPCLFTIAGGKDASGYNTPLFVYVEYEKSYWVNPLGFDFATGEEVDESPTPDNNLKVSVYTLGNISDTQLTEVSTTLIPVKNPEGYYCTFYAIGGLDWTDDIAVDPVANKPERFTVTVVSDITGKEDYTTSYRNYDLQGSLINTIAEDVDRVMMLSDISGKAPQALFTYVRDQRYYFSVVDIATGEEVMALPQNYNGYGLMFNADRVVVDGKILYVFETSEPVNDDDFNVLLPVVWINEEGGLDHVDNYNLGQDIAYATIYIDQSVLDPYLFDADDEMELMFLLKRHVGLGIDTGTREEFGIIGTTDGYMFNAVPDAEKGTLREVSVINFDTDPSLGIVWMHSDDSFTSEFYPLPFERFQQGDGSLENPYQISSLTQLRQIANEPAAHYLIVRDFNASGKEIAPIANFRGSLDGGNHCITGLTIVSPSSSWIGLFGYTAASSDATDGAAVRDLVLLNPSMKVTSQHSRAGIIAGDGMHLTVDNVHIYNADIAVEDGFDGALGAIAGKLTNQSEISSSFVSGVSLEASDAETLGGLVGTMLTGSAVKASAFTGSLAGSENVGGIVGTLAKNGSVTDCHVDADIEARNAVGGIVGYSERGMVNRNVVEGNITATEASRWEKVLAAGGIVGYLTGDYSETAALEGNVVERGPVVTNNVVALQSLNAPEGGTVHRVVGKTSEELAANAYEDEVAKPEPGLENNYVHDILAVIASDGDDLHTSVEGASVDRYDTDPEFFEKLGYGFGENAEEPWCQNGMFVALHFESSISIIPAEMTVVEDDMFFVNVTVHARTSVTEDELLGDFSFSTDEQTLEMTGNYTFTGNVLAIEFKALKEGETTVTINVLGSTATCDVTVVSRASGIDSVSAATASAISFDGENVSCPGVSIDLYSVSGMKVGSGIGSVSVAGLPAGIYVAVAGGSKLKIAVK